MSGRKKGTPNRFTQNLMEICREKNLDVFEALVDIALQVESADRFQALKELAHYLYPKRAAIQHSGEINNPFDSKTVEELENLVLEKISERRRRSLSTGAPSLPEKTSEL